jgi:hypothetical protein
MAEYAIDFRTGGVGVFDRVVKQRRSDGGVIKLKLSEDRRHFERVGNIRVA